MTRISARNTRVLIQYPVNGARDSIGKKERAWVDHGSAWCSFRRLSGGEVIDGDQTTNFATYEVRMLFVDATTLTAHWRLRTGTSEPYTYHHIISADQNDFDRKEWILTVSKDESAKVDAGTIEV